MNLFKEKETKEKKLNCGFSSSKRPMDNLSCKNAPIRLVAVEQISRCGPMLLSPKNLFYNKSKPTILILQCDHNENNSRNGESVPRSEVTAYRVPVDQECTSTTVQK